MDFKKYICPVCSTVFTDEDDVVVCPDCGTPHHRECWNNHGKCFNSQYHGLEIPTANTNISDEPEVIVESVENVELPPENSYENTDNSEENNFSENTGDYTASRNSLIGGKPVVLYEIAVGKNQKYYIPRFLIFDRLQKGISWNFFAFLAPLAWTLYRKMYKFSAIFLAMYFLIFGVMGYFIMQDKDFVNSFEACMQEDPDFYSDVSVYLSGKGNVTLSPAEKAFVDAIDNIKIPNAVNWALSIIPFAARILMGLFANREYMKKLKKNIDSAEKKGLMGNDLKNFIYKKYGTLPLILVVIIGFLEWRMF